MNSTTAVATENQYELRGTSSEFTRAIAALAERTGVEGHQGVERSWWYVDDDAGTAGAVILYADADARLAHHHKAHQGPEMAGLKVSPSAKIPLDGGIWVRVAPLAGDVEDGVGVLVVTAK